MARHGFPQRPRVVVGQRAPDGVGDHAHVALQHAHVVHERGVDEAHLDVGDVHGDGVRGVLARVHRQADGGHGQDVRVRERERVAGVRGVGRGRVRGRYGDEHVRGDRVVRGDGGHLRPAAGGRGTADRVPVHVAELPAVVQPERDAQHDHALDLQTEEREQPDGNAGVGAGRRQRVERGRGAVDRVRQFRVRHVHRLIVVGQASGRPQEQTDRVHAPHHPVRARNARLFNGFPNYRS